MTIECMCLVCHGPIQRRRFNRGVYHTAMTCGINCKGIWHQSLKYGNPLGDRYENLRFTHAYRREMLRFEAWITERVDCHGPLLVGGPAA